MHSDYTYMCNPNDVRLSLDKQKHGSSENTTLCPIPSFTSPKPETIANRIVLNYWVNGNLLKGNHDCGSLEINRWVMILIDIRTSKVLCTCYKTAVVGETATA
ncbi:hypothetical protein TNCV_2313131 [Trichonephila clavipes]|nr:hypothetical protein TNCV_2313131 [Trichonephila clavipes]